MVHEDATSASLFTNLLFRTFALPHVSLQCTCGAKVYQGAAHFYDAQIQLVRYLWYISRDVVKR